MNEFPRLKWAKWPLTAASWLILAKYLQCCQLYQFDCQKLNPLNLICLRSLKTAIILDEIVEIVKNCPFCFAWNIWPWNREKLGTLINRVEHRDISFVFDMRTGCKVNFCCNFCDLVIAGSMGEFLAYPMTTQRLIWMKFNQQMHFKIL